MVWAILSHDINTITNANKRAARAELLARSTGEALGMLQARSLIQRSKLNISGKPGYQTRPLLRLGTNTRSVESRRLRFQSVHCRLNTTSLGAGFGVPWLSPPERGVTGPTCRPWRRQALHAEMKLPTVESWGLCRCGVPAVRDCCKSRHSSPSITTPQIPMPMPLRRPPAPHAHKLITQPSRGPQSSSYSAPLARAMHPHHAELTPAARALVRPPSPHTIPDRTGASSESGDRRLGASAGVRRPGFLSPIV